VSEKALVALPLNGFAPSNDAIAAHLREQADWVDQGEYGGIRNVLMVFEMADGSLRRQTWGSDYGDRTSYDRDRAMSAPSNPGSKAWAHRLVAEYEAGKPTKPTNVYRIAYEALRLDFPEGAQPSAPVQQALPLAAERPVASVPLPKRAPIEDPWWDNEPPATDSN
jgi:hypothetical protein